jgi:hypothetical protein
MPRIAWVLLEIVHNKTLHRRYFVREGQVVGFKMVKYCSAITCHVAKKTIDIEIDRRTGKISVYVDGYEHDVCVALAKKLVGSNILIPSEGDLGPAIRTESSANSTQTKLANKEEIRHE